MSLTFPPSANTGDIYTSGNMSYEFTGTKWKPANRVDYTIQASDIVAANNSLVIDFDVDGIQNLILSEEATVTFANPPAEGEMKRVLLDLGIDPEYIDEITTGFDLVNAEFETGKFKSVAAQDTNPFSVFFKPDGTKMYILGDANDVVYQYALSTPWDVSTALYETGKFKSVAANGGGAVGLFFKPDGTKMYIMGYEADTVYQYALSTPWDVSTALYETGKFKSVAAQATNLRSLFFKPDGTKMYIVGISSSSIYQYALSTPWDLSTALYETGKFKSVATESSGTEGLFFKPDGTKMYTTAAGVAYQYALSTPWDVSTALYETGKFKSVAAEDSQVSGLFFKQDGAKMYTIGSLTDAVYQYNTASVVISIISSIDWPETIEWVAGIPPTLPALNETMLIELEARTDYLGTNYVGRLVGRNF